MSGSYASTPLHRTLLDVARVELGDTRQGELRERIRAGLDWDELVEAAAWHGVDSLLFTHLRDLDVQLPDGIRELLQARYRSTARRNLYLTVELTRLLGAMAEAGIRAVPLKGPVAATHYGNPALRAFGDLDVVVHLADLRGAIQVLDRDGFRPWRSDIEAVVRDPTEYGLPFDRPEGRVCVDLHWGFAWGWFGKTLDFDALWDRGGPMVLAGTEARVLCPGDQLLHMGIHGSKHGPVPWAKLKWIVDMAELMQSHPDSAFAALPHRAEAIGAGRILAFATALVRDLLEAPVPPSLERHLDTHGQVCSQLPWIAEGLWTHGRGSTDLGRRISAPTSTLRERRRDRWRYSWRRIITPTRRDREALSVPRPLHFLYPFFRLGRLGVRYANPRRLARLLKNSAEPL